MNVYQTRRANLATWMAQNSVAFVLFEDAEHRRDPAVRYFCGHPADALLGIRIDGETVLCPWDENMALKTAQVNKIVPYTEFECNPVKAATALAALMEIPTGSRYEIPAATPYPLFLRFVDALTKFDVLCRENGAHDHAKKLRSIKDTDELNCYRTVCDITNALIDAIEAKITDGSIQTESDAALFIEKECRVAGCEGTSFNTLAAGPERSFGIHCFPNYTHAAFPADGLSILDFGIQWHGYGSDVTLTIAKGTLSAGQEELLFLVEKAYAAAIELYKPGASIRAAAAKVDEVFAAAKRKMPHGLGHGVGLEAHEAPRIRNRADVDGVFESGMVVTLEPGLYDAKLGGCRLENTILITADGNETLTRSRIIRL